MESLGWSAHRIRRWPKSHPTKLGNFCRKTSPPKFSWFSAIPISAEPCHLPNPDLALVGDSPNLSKFSRKIRKMGKSGNKNRGLRLTVFWRMPWALGHKGELIFLTVLKLHHKCPSQKEGLEEADHGDILFFVFELAGQIALQIFEEYLALFFDLFRLDFPPRPQFSTTFPDLGHLFLTFHHFHLRKVPTNQKIL